MPIEPKEAVKAAYEYLMNVSTDSARYSNFRIEEVKTDANQNFRITLSYDFVGDLPFERKRVYKDFVINKEDGQVMSMEIRQI